MRRQKITTEQTRIPEGTAVVVLLDGISLTLSLGNKKC